MSKADPAFGEIEGHLVVLEKQEILEHRVTPVMMVDQAMPVPLDLQACRVPRDLADLKDGKVYQAEMVIRAKRDREGQRVTEVREDCRVKKEILAEMADVVSQVNQAFQEPWASRVPEAP